MKDVREDVIAVQGAIQHEPLGCSIGLRLQLGVW